MSNICVILGAGILALIAAAATLIVLLRRPPKCPACKSPMVDEHPCHYECRTCGEHWKESRFGSHGGGDL